ncbi:tRNA:m(4)X modification enzyme TRM13 homolog [Aplochiton taeniatus]
MESKAIPQESSLADGINAPLPGRCGFYVEKKRRFCKMIVAAGNMFCGEHASAENGSKKRRIPCPLDPKHTVFEDSLEKHLKKCNSREKPKPVYYLQDVNAGPALEDRLEYETPLVDRSKTELDMHLDKLRTAVKGLSCKLCHSVLFHPALNDALNDPKNGDAASKHLKQQSSILGNMEALHLLGPNRCFVEFGAGKGKLSHWIHEAMKTHDDYHFLLVERSSTRFKVDGKHQNVGAQFERLQVDIQHLDLSKVPLLRGKEFPVIGVGKHLCGAATDLALRCLLERSGKKDVAEESDQPPSKRPRASAEEEQTSPGRTSPLVGGLAIALCCHHRCDWRHYVGKEFFQEKGLGAAQFDAFQRMSSWATCGQRRANGEPLSHAMTNRQEEEEHEPIAEAEPDDMVGSAGDREHIGRLCKLLIDQGRVHYLEQRGYKTTLQYYTSTDVTLENVLLTAIPATPQ